MARNQKQRAINKYHQAIKYFYKIAKNANPKPGKMTKKQEAAQCEVINCYLALSELDGVE